MQPAVARVRRNRVATARTNQGALEGSPSSVNSTSFVQWSVFSPGVQLPVVFSVCAACAASIRPSSAAMQLRQWKRSALRLDFRVRTGLGALRVVSIRRQA